MSAAAIASGTVHLQSVLVVLAIIALVLFICWMLFGRGRRGPL